MKHYRDYFWNEGKPIGVNAQSEKGGSSVTSYKIVSDPYNKWISIEKYVGRKFDCIVYDSLIFDFRNLKPINQTAWEKETIENGSETSIIRNQDDRIILFEEYSFDGNRCLGCKTRSVHGIPVSTQKICYKDLGDSINGVALFDTNNHIVMYKLYDVDSQTGEFTNLIKEKWNMKDEDISKWQLSPSKNKS